MWISAIGVDASLGRDEALIVKTKSKALPGGETEPAKFIPKEALFALVGMPEVEKREV